MRSGRRALAFRWALSVRVQRSDLIEPRGLPAATAIAAPSGPWPPSTGRALPVSRSVPPAPRSSRTAGLSTLPATSICSTALIPGAAACLRYPARQADRLPCRESIVRRTWRCGRRWIGGGTTTTVPIGVCPTCPRRTSAARGRSPGPPERPRSAVAAGPRPGPSDSARCTAPSCRSPVPASAGATRARCDTDKYEAIVERSVGAPPASELDRRAPARLRLRGLVTGLEPRADRNAPPRARRGR